MNNPDLRSLQSYRRVQGWEVAHNDIVNAAPAAVRDFFAKLGEVTVQVEAHAVTQDAQHRLRTRNATDATPRRTAVRDAMRPIAQVARTLQGTVFGISAISKMPNPKLDNDRLVTVANSMVESSSVFRTTLIAHGLQPDCIETLQTAAAALKSSINARGLARATAVGASKGIRSGIREGNRLVSIIDAGLMPLLKNDQANLASWKNAKRITTKGVVGVIIPLAPQGPVVAAPSTTPVATTAAPVQQHAA